MDKQKIKILIVDDEKDIRDSLKDILVDEGYETLLAKNVSEAKEIKLSQKIDLILLDIWMPDIDGLSLLKEWAANNEINCPVIMMSGHGTIDTAIEATKIGATDFLEKPISLQKLLKTISSSLKKLVVLDEIDKTFIAECNLKYIKDIENEINQLKKMYLVSFVGEKTNFMGIFISILFNTNYYLVKKASDINNNLLNLIQTSGLKFLLIDNCLGSLEKNNEYEELFNEINSKKIKIIFLEKERASFGKFFKNENNISFYEAPDFSNDRDIIPDLANALLAYHLSKNSNLPFKVLDSAALNALRNHPDIQRIDQLDKVITSSIKSSAGELINRHDVESFFDQHNVSVEKNYKTDINIDVLYKKPLKEARDSFETMYLKYHLEKNKSITNLSNKSGIERTHLYRKLKQLGIKV